MAKKSKSKRASYSAEADALRKKIEQTRGGMPGLKELAIAVKNKGGGGVVSDRFIEGIAAHAEIDPEFAKATGVDPDRLRNGNRFVIAFGPVADFVMTFGDEARQLVLETRKRNSVEARAAYAWMQWKADHQKDASYARVVKKLKPLMKPGTSKAGKGKSKAKRTSKSAPTPKADSKVTQTTTSETVTEKN